MDIFQHFIVFKLKLKDETKANAPSAKVIKILEPKLKFKFLRRKKNVEILSFYRTKFLSISKLVKKPLFFAVLEDPLVKDSSGLELIFL
jgi:hypothetical protein